MKIALACCLLVAGCHLDDLLYPGPPPEETEQVCYQYVRWRIIQQQDADTTYHASRRQVPCGEPNGGD